MGTDIYYITQAYGTEYRYSGERNGEVYLFVFELPWDIPTPCVCHQIIAKNYRYQN